MGTPNREPQECSRNVVYLPESLCSHSISTSFLGGRHKRPFRMKGSCCGCPYNTSPAMPFSVHIKASACRKLPYVTIHMQVWYLSRPYSQNVTCLRQNRILKCQIIQMGSSSAKRGHRNSQLLPHLLLGGGGGLACQKRSVMDPQGTSIMGLMASV